MLTKVEFAKHLLGYLFFFMYDTATKYSKILSKPDGSLVVLYYLLIQQV